MRDCLFAPRVWAVGLCSAALALFSAVASADPPTRAARLAQIGGTVSFSPAGEQDWEIAPANRPVTTGDRLWADARSHAELQIGAAAARLGENTALTVLNLDDRIAQFQLAQGELNVRIRRIDGDQFYEIDTPNLAFSIRRVGDYRIDVDPDGSTTVIRVRDGQGEAWGEGTAYVIDPGQQYTFRGEGLRDYTSDPIAAPDEFDRWCFDRNRREDTAVAARYVSPEMVGYSDLDDYGTWRNVEGYGTVWVPTHVAVDWVPYHYGHWGWVDPWGWTWIDSAPWGFAPFHYGRWAYLSSRWCWVPGPVAVRAVYAPALVAFVGGGGFSLSISTGPVAGVAWFPLGVGEVYRPAYEVSRTYFTQINVTNTVVNTTYVTNVYNNPNVQVNYRNREVVNAVTAVPANSFASGEPVERHAVRVSREVVERQPVSHVAAITPTHAAVLAAGAAAGAVAVAAAHRPPERALTRQVVARTQPPAAAPSFSARSSLLSQQPGRPLDAEKMRSVRTERAAEAPRVKMVSPGVTPRALDKGQARAGPGGAGPAGQAQEERAAKQRRGPPQPGGVAQPPASAQERFKGGPPQGQAAEERAARERRGPSGGSQAGPAMGQAQEERAAKERRGGPQSSGAPQPPASAQERFKGGPPSEGGQRERAQQQQTQQRAQQERAQQERAQQQQTQQRAQQERAQQERAQQQQTQQRAQQERAQQQRAQEQQAQQRAQQQAQQERAQRAPQGKGQQEKEKEKEKEPRGQPSQ